MRKEDSPFASSFIQGQRRIAALFKISFRKKDRVKNMSKTPITLLQETMIKHSVVPMYEEIGGTPQSRFVIRVKCKHFYADGRGCSKKEAKQNAAMEMLTILTKSGEIPHSTLLVLNNGLPSKQIETINSSVPSLSSIFPNSSTSLPSSSESFTSLSDSFTNSPSSFSSSPRTIVNYVGRLQEYCKERRLTDPCYDIVNITGPSHLTTFTMSCTVSSMQESASANTKKNAKHEAAKKMLKRLLGDISSLECIPQYKVTSCGMTKDDISNELGIQFIDLKIKEKVLSRYKEPSKKYVPTAHNLPVEQYHVALSNLCCNISQTQKEHLINMYNRKEDCTVLELRNAIFTAMRSVPIQINFTTISKDHFVVGFRLAVQPTILQIGIGKTREEAEKQALYKFLETIFLLMK